MADIIRCPMCAKMVHLPEEAQGKRVRCPFCKKFFHAPEPKPPEPDLPPRRKAEHYQEDEELWNEPIGREERPWDISLGSESFLLDNTRRFTSMLNYVGIGLFLLAFFSLNLVVSYGMPRWTSNYGISGLVDILPMIFSVGGCMLPVFLGVLVFRTSRLFRNFGMNPNQKNLCEAFNQLNTATFVLSISLTMLVVGLMVATFAYLMHQNPYPVGYSI